MAQATKFKSWQKMGEPAAPYVTKSPNLVQIHAYCRDTWKMTNLGIYNRRPIRGGTVWSSHAFGAALDLGYTDRAQLEWIILPWLINHSRELGIQRIHDYTGKRYWQAGKGMVPRSPGLGGLWIHVETHVDDWGNSTPVKARLST